MCGADVSAGLLYFDKRRRVSEEAIVGVRYSFPQ
jgi:hypothetical protein